MQGLGHGQHHVAIRYPLIERPPDVGYPFIHVYLAAGEAEAALTAEGHPFLFQAVRAQIRRIARLHGATAEHVVDDGLHVAILIPRMALLEGLPVIAEDLLEGVFVDPLPCGDHSACLGFDHGVGHPLLLLCDAKAPNYRKNKVFKDLDHCAKWPTVANAVIKAHVCTTSLHPEPPGYALSSDPLSLSSPPVGTGRRGISKKEILR